MTSEQDIAKRFSEELDRILAGKESQAQQITDSDLRSVLDFSGKMADLREEPSPQFSSIFKAKLLQKLEAREAQAESKRSWFANLIRQPVWQAATVVVIVLIIVGVIWNYGLFMTTVPTPTVAPTPTPTTTATTTTPRPTTTTPTPTPVPGTRIYASAGTDKTNYIPGESVNIELIIRNDGKEPFQMDKTPILSLMREGTREPVYTFAAAAQSRTLAPNEVSRYTFKWNQLDHTGVQVTGSYYIELEDLQSRGQPIKLDLATPVRFNITY